MPGLMDLVNQGNGGNVMLAQSPNLEATKELIRSPEQDDFITVLDFADADQAINFTIAVNKCRKHKLTDKEAWLWLVAKSLVSVKGKRADKYSMTLARLLVPEAYGGSSVKNNGDRNDNHKGNS